MTSKLLTLRNIFSAVPKLRGKLDPEDQICYEFADKLRDLQLDGETLKDFTWAHIANEFAGKSSPVFGMKLKAIGKVKGWPDYIFMWEGGCGAIEFKTPTGRQSKEQKAVQAWFDMSGVDYRVARCAGEAFDVLAEWRLI